jgi:hypothetical protein
MDNRSMALGPITVMIAMNASLKSTPSLVAALPLDPICERSVDRLLKAAGATPATCITVAGPSAGAAMSALWRRGVERVEAARRITSPSADQLSQVLLIVGCAEFDKIAETLTNVLPILAPGGVLGVDASLLPSVSERVRLCRLLAHRGLRYRDGIELYAEIVAYKPDLETLFAMAS